MSAARKILFNTASQVIAKVFIGVISVVVLKLLTTYLGRTGFGFYKSIFEFLALFAIVADLGLFTIGVREMSKNPENEQKVLGNMMTIRTILIAVISVVAVIASFFVAEYSGTIAPYAVAVASVASTFAILTGTVSTALQVHLKMEWNSVASVAGKVVSILYMLLVIFVWFPHNCDTSVVDFLSQNGACTISDMAFLNLIAAGIVGNLVMFLISYYFANKVVKVRYRFDYDFIKEVIWKSLPYGIALVLNQIYFRIGSVMLLTMNGADAVAIYSAPLTVLEAAGIIPQYFANAILPFLTRALYNKTGEHKTIIQLSFDFMMMTALPILAGTLLLAYQFISIIATEEFLTNTATGFYGSDVVLQILIVALVFSFLNGLFGYVIIAANQQHKLLMRNLVGAIITVVLTYLLIPIWAERGAAVANVATEIYIAAASFYLAKKYVDFNLNLKTFWKILVSTGVMTIFLFTVKDTFLNMLGIDSLFKLALGTSILIAVSAGIYFITLFLTGGITKDMIKIVLKRNK